MPGTLLLVIHFALGGVSVCKFAHPFWSRALASQIAACLASVRETAAGYKQARNEVQRVAALLGAALFGNLTRLGAHLRDVEARKQRAAGPGDTGHAQRLGGLLPWVRRRRRGGHHDVGALLCGPNLCLKGRACYFR